MIYILIFVILIKKYYDSVNIFYLNLGFMLNYNFKIKNVNLDIISCVVFLIYFWK